MTISLSRSAGRARINPESSSLTAMRTAWKMRAKSGAPLRGPSTANRIDEIVSRREWSTVPTTDNLARQPRSTWFIGIGAQQGGQIDLVDGIEQPSRIEIGIGTHAHIQRCPFAEREAARRIIELMRGHAQVKQNPIEALGVRETGRLQIGIIAEQHTQLAGAFKVSETLARGCQRARITVNSGDPHPAREKRRRVTSTAERTIQHGPGVDQHGLDLGKQNGDMVCPGASIDGRANLGHAQSGNTLRRHMDERCNRLRTNGARQWPVMLADTAEQRQAKRSGTAMCTTQSAARM